MNYTVSKGVVNMRKICLFILLSSVMLLADSTAVDTPALAVGSEAPGCYAKTLDGNDFFLSRYTGARARSHLKGPVVLSFFTTSCIPCRKEIPFLHTLSAEYPDLTVYLVNVGEEKDLVEKYIAAKGYTLPVLLDRYGKIAENYCAVVTPTLVAINPAGNVVLFKRGFKDSDQETIKKAFVKLSDNTDR
jgi:thiol-disulfide isomerase/thioredoxin